MSQTILGPTINQVTPAREKATLAHWQWRLGKVAHMLRKSLLTLTLTHTHKIWLGTRVRIHYYIKEILHRKDNSTQGPSTVNPNKSKGLCQAHGANFSQSEVCAATPSKNKHPVGSVGSSLRIHSETLRIALSAIYCDLANMQRYAGLAS